MASYTQTRAIVAKALEEPAASPPFSLETLEIGEPEDDEVIVRMVATGICHTDINFAMMPGPDKVLGHEGAARIVRTGKNVTTVSPGDAVLLSYRTCGACGACSSRRPHGCRDILHLNFPHPATFKQPAAPSPDVAGLFFGQSSLAHLSRAHIRSVVPLGPLLAPLNLALPSPSASSSEDANADADADADRASILPFLAPLGCGIMTGAGSVVNVALPHLALTAAAPAASALLVSGLGAVGFGAVLAAAASGFGTIVALDRVRARLDLAKELGATHVLDGSADGFDLPSAVRAVAPGGVDAVVESTAAGAVISDALRSVARGGLAVLLGQAGPALAASGATMPYNEMSLAGATIKFVMMGESEPGVMVPRMLRWWREGKFPLERLVKPYPVERWEEAVGAMLESGDVVKPVVVW